MSERFKYIRYDQESIDKSEEIKKICELLEEKIDGLGKGRAGATALTKLEECFMWVGKQIRDNQVVRGIQTEHKPERGE